VQATNVADSLFKDFTDPSGKTPLYNNNADLDKDKKVIINSIKDRINNKQLEEKFDKDSGCAYAFDSTNKVFISYDNINSVTEKVCYAIHQCKGVIWMTSLFVII
jgi:GH18 family chitinase